MFCLSCSASFSLTRRATVSLVPPGASGTTSRRGRAVCACAGATDEKSAAAKTTAAGNDDRTMSVERLLAGVFENVETALRAVARIDEAAIVDEDVADAAAALPLRRLGQECGDLLGRERVADVVNTQARAEPGGDDGVLELRAAGLGLVLVDV